MTGDGLTTIAFFVGIVVIALINKFIPSEGNPHEVGNIKQETDGPEEKMTGRKLLRMGMFSALAIGIYNFPEGVAVSVPIYFATRSKGKAFWYSFLSGLAEPVGALVGFFLLRAFFDDLAFGLIFAGVAGIMVYISLDEFLPTAEEYCEHHVAIGGLIAGMAVMAVSLLLFV